jgi:putative hydrolase of the HAD superfamily
VIAARGLSGLFDAVYGVEHAHYRPKPEREAFETIFLPPIGTDPTAPRCSKMMRETSPPHMRIGMRTVHVAQARTS